MISVPVFLAVICSGFLAGVVVGGIVGIVCYKLGYRHGREWP